MPTNSKRRLEDGALVNLDGTWVSYEGMFDDGSSMAERYSSLKVAATNEIANLPDKYCEEFDEPYAVRHLLKRFTMNDFPAVQWDSVFEIDSSSRDNTVTVIYGILIEGEKHEFGGLYYGLPCGTKDDRSEFVRFGQTGYGHQPMLVVKFTIPRATWDEQGGIEWFQSIRDNDFEWLKRVVGVFKEQELEHNNQIAGLIYQRVKDRYDFAKNFSWQLGTMPRPSIVSDSDELRSDKFDDPRFRVHKRFLFGQQEGICNGCRNAFEFKNMTIDHIVPKSKGGSNEFDNLQLLCRPCNELKADGAMEDLQIALDQRKLSVSRSIQNRFSQSYRFRDRWLWVRRSLMIGSTPYT